jgi:DNA-binding MarR family transcriptional regulator
MFELRDLPDATTLEGFGKRFPELDISALQVVLRLAKLGEDLVRFMQDGLMRDGLSLRRFFVLVLLARNTEGLRAVGLAKKMGVTKATVSEVLAGMSRDRLVQSCADPEDSRAQLITLSEQGKALLDAALPGHYRRLAGVVEGLDGDNRAELLRLLEIVSKGLE